MWLLDEFFLYVFIYRSCFGYSHIYVFLTKFMFFSYLLFHKQNSSLMNPACSQSEMALNIAHMWEKLEPDDRAAYSKMAALEQSDDSNDLSADLLAIDLRPLHKEQNGLSITIKIDLIC